MLKAPKLTIMRTKFEVRSFTRSWDNNIIDCDSETADQVWPACVVARWPCCLERLPGNVRQAQTQPHFKFKRLLKTCLF